MLYKTSRKEIVKVEQISHETHPNLIPNLKSSPEFPKKICIRDTSPYEGDISPTIPQITIKNLSSSPKDGKQLELINHQEIQEMQSHDDFESAFMDCTVSPRRPAKERLRHSFSAIWRKSFGTSNSLGSARSA